MKQYNLNTKYGRKKAREQAAQNYANMTPEQQSEHDSMGCFAVAVIIGIVAIIIFAAGGDFMDLLNWLSR